MKSKVTRELATQDKHFQQKQANFKLDVEQKQQTMQEGIQYQAMNVERVMEEVQFKLAKVDASQVVIDHCQNMIDALQKEIDERMTNQNRDFSEQIKIIYEEELSHLGLFGRKLQDKDNKFQNFKMYALDCERKQMKLIKECKEVMDHSKKNEIKIRTLD